MDTLDDSLAEITETFGAELSSPNGNGLSFTLGSQDTATADIMDNDRKDINDCLYLFFIYFFGIFFSIAGPV